MCHSFDTGPPVVTRQNVPILGLGEKRTIFRGTRGQSVIMDIMVASPCRTFTFSRPRSNYFGRSNAGLVPGNCGKLGAVAPHFSTQL
jgi:hypothetical protein